MEYSVGQVLYALSNKEMAVIPLRITEKILRQTLEGEVISYVAETANGKKVEDMSRLSATFYVSPDEVREALIENVTKVVQKIVDSASISASQAFGQNTTQPEKEIKLTEKSSLPVSSGENTVTLPDGTVAKVKIPENLAG